MARSYTLKTDGPGGGAGTIDFKNELNEQQYDAVTAPPGQALVIAGAGSGKTRTLTYRVAYLLENGVLPTNILLLTFTNKAAREMLQRVETLIPGQTVGLWSGTFHSICNRILRQHSDLIGYTRGFSILDGEDQKAILRKSIKETGVADAMKKRSPPENFPKPAVVSSIISLAANTTNSLTDIIEDRYSYFDGMAEAMFKVATLYRKKKKEANSMDFDDLLVNTRRLLEEHETVRKEYQYQFQFTLVDEYQDTNAVQGEIIDLLAGDKGNIMVVGDDAQSIYSWRGAHFQNILEFPKRYPGASVFKIETNYRSVPEILNLANEAILANVRQFEKTLAPAREPAGELPAYIPIDTPSMQSRFICQRVRELNDEGIELEDMAVLYRSHFHSMDLQMRLTTEGMPFSITSGMRFFEQAHIKDVSSFLKFVINRQDEACFDRMVGLIPGVGPTTAERMRQQWLSSPASIAEALPDSFSKVLAQIKVPAKATKMWQQYGFVFDEMVRNGEVAKPAEMLASVIEGVYKEYMMATYDNFESRLQDLEQLQLFSEGFDDVFEFLEQMALLGSADDGPGSKSNESGPRSGLNLSTVHQAKGLEWKVVFIIGLFDGGFPNYRTVEEGGDDSLEEERRLFYVAITRAEDQLYLLYPMISPRAYGGDTMHSPSRFINEIAPEFREEWRIGSF